MFRKAFEKLGISLDHNEQFEFTWPLSLFTKNEGSLSAELIYCTKLRH